MDIVVSLAHFCEVHGPTSILCTQILPISCLSCFPPELKSSPKSSSLKDGSSRNDQRTSSSGSVASLAQNFHRSMSVHSENSGVAARGSRGNRDPYNRSPLDSPLDTPPMSPTGMNIEDHPKYVGGYTPQEVPRRSGASGAPNGDTCESCAMSLPKSVEEQLPEGGPGSPTKDGRSTSSPILRSRETLPVVTVRDDWRDEVDMQKHNHDILRGSNTGSGSGRKVSRDTSNISQASSSNGSKSQHTHTLTYLSTRHPPSGTSYSLLRRSCIRALSCESLPHRTTAGPIIFGDAMSGFTIAYIFRIPDPRARGRRRLYALIALAGRDGRRAVKTSAVIINAFQTIARAMTELAERAQDGGVASKGKEEPGASSSSGISSGIRNVTPVSSFLSGRTVDPDGYPRRAGEIRAKGLAELVGQEDFFVTLHMTFVTLLAQLGREFGGQPWPDSIIDSGIHGPVGEETATTGRAVERKSVSDRQIPPAIVEQKKVEEKEKKLVQKGPQKAQQGAASLGLKTPALQLRRKDSSSTSSSRTTASPRADNPVVDAGARQQVVM